MTEILLPRPTSGQIPDFVPVSNQALSYDLKNLLWLQNAKPGEGLINTGVDFQTTGMLPKDSVDYKLITKIGGKFYVLSGMGVFVTSGTTLLVIAGTAVINGVVHDFQRRDNLVMSGSTYPDGVYTINVNAVSGISINAFHYFSENILAYVIMQGGVIDHVVDASVRGTPLFNLLSNLAGAIGIVTKNIAIVPTGPNTIRRTQGVFIGRMSEEISLPELSPAMMEVMTSAIIFKAPAANLEIRNLHRLENGPNIKPTEYAVIPYFVRRSGVISFLQSQAVLTDVSQIEDVHIKHILNQYIIPASLSREAGMIGVLILKGDENSLNGPGAYYYPLTLNKNTILRSTGHQLPTLTNSDTGLLYYDDATNLFDLKNLFGINPQYGDFFVKKNNALVNAREAFANLQHPGFNLSGHIAGVPNSHIRLDKMESAIAGNYFVRIRNPDYQIGLLTYLNIRGVISSDSITIRASVYKYSTQGDPGMLPFMTFFVKVNLGSYAKSIYGLDTMQLDFFVPAKMTAQVFHGYNREDYCATVVSKTFFVKAVNANSIPATPTVADMYQGNMDFDSVCDAQVCVIYT